MPRRKPKRIERDSSTDRGSPKETGRSRVAGGWKSIAGFLGNPIVGLLLSIVLSLIFYFVSLREMKPAYTISPPEVIARKEKGATGVRIFYQDKEVPVVYRTRVVVWNAGSQTIEKSAISKDRPICITIPSNVSLLDYRVSATSRRDLQIVPTRAGVGCVALTISGDEALEPDDGGVVELLYAGTEGSPFAVSGRIKGAAEGFVKASWDYSVRKKLEFREWAFLFNTTILTIAGAVMFAVEIRRFRAGEKNNIVIGSLSFFPLTLLNIYTIKPMFFGLSWVMR